MAHHPSTRRHRYKVTNMTQGKLTSRPSTPLRRNSRLLMSLTSLFLRNRCDSAAFNDPDGYGGNTTEGGGNTTGASAAEESAPESS